MRRRDVLEGVVSAGALPFVPDFDSLESDGDEEVEWVEEQRMWITSSKDHEVRLRGRENEIVIYRPLTYAFPYLQGEQMVVRDQRRGNGLYKIEPWRAESTPAPRFGDRSIAKYVWEDDKKKTIFYNYYDEVHQEQGWGSTEGEFR